MSKNEFKISLDCPFKLTEKKKKQHFTLRIKASRPYRARTYVWGCNNVHNIVDLRGLYKEDWEGI
jgi:hypothetical protein